MLDRDTETLNAMAGIPHLKGGVAPLRHSLARQNYDTRVTARLAGEAAERRAAEQREIAKAHADVFRGFRGALATFLAAWTPFRRT